MKLMKYILTEVENPQYVVQILHGMQDHKGRYRRLQKNLALKNIASIIHDHNGHGVSSDNLGTITKSFDEMVDEAYQYTCILKERYPHAKIILFGHSMGSIMARCYLQRYSHELDGIILSGSPFFDNNSKFGIMLLNTLRVFNMDDKKLNWISKLLFKNADRKYKDLAWLSKNPMNVSEYKKDKYCGMTLNVNGYLTILKGLVQMHDISCYANVNTKLPILFLSGQDDPMIGGIKGLNDSINTLKKAGYSNIESIEYPTLRHEILNENYELVYLDIFKFIETI